jgi:hypothetical protein
MLLKGLIEVQDAQVSKEHCKGMEGLVNEAIKHTIDDAPDKGPGARQKDMYVADALMNELAEAAVNDDAVDE